MRTWTENSGYVTSVDDQSWESFCDRAVHFVGDATSPDDIQRLRSDIGEDEIVFYLSTPPSIFAPICKAMGEAGVVSQDTRLVVEKPLGTSQESFKQINNTLFETFEEHQIYRIDHYLGKETVQNLLALRFANIFFEPLWNRRCRRALELL